MQTRTSTGQRSRFSTRLLDFGSYLGLALKTFNPGFCHGLRYASRAPIRLLQNTDVPHLVELNSILEEREQIPGGYTDHFRSDLVCNEMLCLVVEDPASGLPIACGSISGRDHLPGAGLLSFGLVHPDHQGRGLGTSLFYARIALLKPEEHDRISIRLSATDFSRPWFTKLGITWGNPYTDLRGNSLYPGWWNLLHSDLQFVQAHMFPLLPSEIREKTVPNPDTPSPATLHAG